MTALKHLPRLARAAILATAASATLVALTAPQPALAHPSGYHHYYRWQRSGGSWIRIGFYSAPSPGFYPGVGYVGYAPPPVYAVPSYDVPTYAAPPPYYYAPAPVYYRPAYYGPSVSLGFFFGGRGYYGRPYYYHGYHGWRR
jgi:hypothetical protein